VVSWNVQLMNKLDGPNDSEIAKAVEDKAERISRVVAEPRAGGGGRPASLLVIQEAPGPQLRVSGGKNAKEIAKGNVFTQKLQEKLPRFSSREVALSNKDQKLEMGEDHIFFWDPAVLTLVDGPQPLKPPSGKEWIARAPSWAEFEVAKIWGDGHRLVVVSVHAKSGGKKETVRDVRMIGKAVSILISTRKLHERDGPSNLSVLITGDFNLEPDVSLSVFCSSFGDREQDFKFKLPKDCPKTNIWRFNGCGSEEKDGHAYDTGFFSSTMQGHTVSAALPPPALDEQRKIHQEMEQMAKKFKELFGTEGPEVSESEVMRRTLKVVLNTDGSSDGVPSWLRQEFCHQVKLVWSDHLPIAVSITMPRCQLSPGTEPEPH
jgi:hypothetical protein